MFLLIWILRCVPIHVIVRLGGWEAEKVDRGEPGRQRRLLYGPPEKLPPCCIRETGRRGSQGIPLSLHQNWRAKRTDKEDPASPERRPASPRTRSLPGWGPEPAVRSVRRTNLGPVHACVPHRGHDRFMEEKMTFCCCFFLINLYCSTPRWNNAVLIPDHQWNRKKKSSLLSGTAFYVRYWWTAVNCATALDKKKNINFFRK